MTIHLSEGSIVTIILFIVGYIVTGIVILINMHIRIKLLKVNYDSVLKKLERLINVFNGVEGELRACQLQLATSNQEFKNHKEEFGEFKERMLGDKK